MSEYIIINKKKYNIEKWKLQHPGGNVFTNYNRQDCTAIFYAYHNYDDPYISSILSKLELCNYDENLLSEIDSDYIILHKLFIELGFYNIDKNYYLKKILFLIILLSGAIYFNNKIAITSGCLFGLCIQQSGFLGHDIGHNYVLSKTKGIFNQKYKYIWAYIFGNIMFGVDGLNWSHNHNEHHYLTCVPGKDIQNDHLPFILYKKTEIDILPYKLNFLNKLLLQYQWLYILPILFTIGKFNIMLDIDNQKLISEKKNIRIFGILLHIIIWLLFINLSINPLMFILGGLFFNGMIHLQIILSHAFMPRLTIDEIYSKGWIVSQAITTINIKTSWYDDWFHGGLQYQLDHHLFPRIPRHNLKKIQPYIEQFCNKHNIKYNIMSFSKAIFKFIKSLYTEARLL
jgi:fatty acid desaturase